MKTCFVLLFLLLSLSETTAQLKQRSQAWYLQNDRKNRYEGSFTQEVSSVRDFSLISLVVNGIEPYEFGRAQMLTARYFCPQVYKYLLKAEDCEANAFYWMEDKRTTSKQGWNLFQWEVDDYLQRLHIGPGDLGITFELGDQEDYFLPVQLYHKTQPTKAVYYIAQIRAGVSFRNGKLNVYSGTRAIKEKFLYSEGLLPQSAGSCMPLRIKADKLGAEGWKTVVLTVSEKEKLEEVNFTFRFYHKP